MINKILTAADFADLFGTTTEGLPDICHDLIAKGNWSYQNLERGARDKTILDFLLRLEKKEFSFVKEGEKSRWITGWGENLAHFEETGGDIEALVPRYIRPGIPVRLNGDFVLTKDDEFELKWYEVFREWLFYTYLQDFDHVFEFGCGSGFNVARLAELYPSTTIHGLDWAEPSVQIVERLRELRDLNVKGHQFDFFHPDYDLDIPENSAIITIGALEQTGTNNRPFLDFLMSKRPALCINVEPTIDWYDPNKLVDHLAIRAHQLRNFWQGYHQDLDALEKAGTVEILKTKRAFFGSLVLEGYSQTIWRPTR